jgi:hypothetical protein
LAQPAAAKGGPLIPSSGLANPRLFNSNVAMVQSKLKGMTAEAENLRGKPPKIEARRENEMQARA